MRTYIHSAEVSCGLGSSLTACLQQLKDKRISNELIQLDMVGDQLNTRYFRLTDRVAQSADDFSASGLTVHSPGSDSPTSHAQMYYAIAAQIETVLSRAGLSREERQRTGLFVGSSSFSAGYSEDTYLSKRAAGEPEPLLLETIGYDKMLEMLVVEHGFSECSFAYATACTSSANAMLYANRFIASGAIDHAVVLGYELFNRTTLLGFYGLGLLSQQGAMMPFDARRDGLLLGEGFGSLLLSREARSGTIVFCGGASNTDHFSLTAANTDGSTIAAVMHEAMKKAGVDSDGIVGIKTHGTASLFNDEAETAGIDRIGCHDKKLFALKPYVGHTLGGCGAIEAILTTAALAEGWMPGNPGFSTDDTLSVVLNQDVIAAPPGGYLLNFFAFGGNNSCLVALKA